MKKVILPKNISHLIGKLKKDHKKIVLAGGCFDILHEGHLVFLEKAKNQGDVLIIFLEEDENVKKLKGINRPMHTQRERAEILSSVKFVDYIIMLSQMKKASDYAKLVNQIGPSVIAITSDDPCLDKKEKQAAKIRAKIIPVTKRIAGKSTTKLVRLIKKDLWKKQLSYL